MSIYSIHGKGLKLDTRADIEPYLREIQPEVLEEIHLGGNTIGIEAAQALAEVLQKATNLRVRLSCPCPREGYSLSTHRLPTMLISSLAD